jgi:hypothetical protein
MTNNNLINFILDCHHPRHEPLCFIIDRCALWLRILFTLSLIEGNSRRVFRLVGASISLTLPMTTTVRLRTQRCFRRYPPAPLAEGENRAQPVPLALLDRLTVCVHPF